jgi:hypothetical protein
MSNIFWPGVDDLWSAKKACAQGSSVSLLVGAVTGVLAFMSLSGKQVLPEIDGKNFIDAAIFLVLSFFIYRCSRIAAVVALLLYYFGQVMIFQQTRHFPTSAIFFGLLFVGGVRGAFAFHELKQGLSEEDVREFLKKQREETEPQPSLKKRIVAWTVLIVLAGGGYWWYRSAAKRPEPRMVVKSSSPASVLPEIKIPSIPVPGPQAKSIPPSAVPEPSSPGKQIFKLQDGRTVTGRVITDDPVYYTVETSGGRQEIVIKEDVVS